MPKSLRVVVVLICAAIAISPVVVAPGIAESYGADRSTGSTIGALIGMALFALMGWVSIKISRKQARREVGAELDRLLAPHRNDEGGTNDEGKEQR